MVTALKDTLNNRIILFQPTTLLDFPCLRLAGTQGPAADNKK